MKTQKKTNPINIFLCLFFSFYLVSCGPLAFKRSDVKDNPINDADKRKKNIEEGRGLRLVEVLVDIIMEIFHLQTQMSFGEQR
jgi:hypothetical protein